MIKNIIFDLGNVLVNVDYTNFKNKLESLGVSQESYTRIFTGNNYRNIGYETGKVTTAQFVEKCIKELNMNMSEQEFSDAFNDMFKEIEHMSNLVRELANEGRYNLFLLSNTSPLHFDYIKENFDYINLLHKFALSYELKSIKPEEAIYKRALDLFNINPNESVFIDDLEENCRGAEKFGIKTIQYAEHDIFLEKFNDFLTL